MCIFSLSVGEGLADLPIWVLSYLSAVGEHDIFLSICKLYGFDSIFLNALDRAIREDALFLTVCEDTLNGAVGEAKI